MGSQLCLGSAFHWLGPDEYRAVRPCDFWDFGGVSVNDIMQMYLQYETELEKRIANSQFQISTSRTIIESAEKNIIRDTETLTELRRLMEEYR